MSKTARRLFIAVGTMLLLGVGIPSTVKAQTTYNDVERTTSAGEPGRVVFSFGFWPPNGNPGLTQLVIQCDISAPFPSGGRAWLITNYDTLEQRESNFFPITCTFPEYPTGQYVLNATPLVENLTMYSNSNSSTTSLTLTINSAVWQTTGYGRYARTTGSAQIVY